MITDTKPQLAYRDVGKLVVNLHPGQAVAYQSEARIVAAIAGAQSGKSRFGPYWLAREIQRKGPGDYMIAGPDYQLMGRTVFPAFLQLFTTDHKWGKICGKDSHFEFSKYGEQQMWGSAQSTKTKVFFGHADRPESLESATLKGVWLDEAGQVKFKLESWEAINRRIAVNQARILLTTTPYTLGWLYQQVWQKAASRISVLKDEATGQAYQTKFTNPDGDKAIEVINWDSRLNPAFPVEEYQRQEGLMPDWKFKLFYRGIFTRPAGVIYDCFEETKHRVTPFMIPATWPRYIGLDFGGVHTAAVFLAAEISPDGTKETGRLFVYREYPPGGRWASMPAKEHAKALLQGEASKPIAVGGSSSEDQWRSEFGAGGLHVKEPPIKEVEVGIDRVYGAIKRNELYVFDTCAGLLDELGRYSRELDGAGNVTEKIFEKETYHRCDSLRYVLSYLKGGRKQLWIA